MNLNSKALVGVPVRTKAGQLVGKLSSLEIDSETGRISLLRVRVRGMVPGLLDDEAFVAWSQVVSMSEKEIVVVDASVPATARLAKSDFAAPSAHLKEQST
ncbi:PRC-barrel domain-containing protein [Candidatus Uhrbacteria bacterium]|nr:PRC-barrel domain-containing protein [Candidatus Uhrbacteria bacterium]